MVRNAKGQFIKGHENVGAGRKPKTAEEKFLKAFTDAVEPKDITDIAHMLVKKSKNGSIEATRLLFSYLFGLPVQKNEHTGKDGGPIVLINWDGDSND